VGTEPGPGRRPRRRAQVVAVLAAVAALAVACSSTSTTRELSAEDDPGGPLPTAPVEGASTGSREGGAVDVAELVRRIDALGSETDLCLLLTGEALADVTGANLDLTSLTSDPAGFTQLFTALDRLFAHMVTIGPPETQPALRTMQGVWAGVAAVDPAAPDAAARAGALIAAPEVQAAQAELGAWVRSSCGA
jgi:hypothetical protein